MNFYEDVRNFSMSFSKNYLSDSHKIIPMVRYFIANGEWTPEPTNTGTYRMFTAYAAPGT
jgi:hypothetical protein